MSHFWTENTCAPHMTYLSEGKRVICNQNKTPPTLSSSSSFILLFLSFLLLNLQIAVETLKSHASIEELTLKRRHRVQRYFLFCNLFSG